MSLTWNRTPEHQEKVLAGLDKARERAALLRRAGEIDNNAFGHGGALAAQRARQQFQIIYDFFGGLAFDIYEDFIVWADDRRPSRQQLLNWCGQVDTGEADIPDIIREAVMRRLASFVRGEAIATQRASGRLVRKIADAVVAELDKPDPDQQRLAMLKDLSGIYQHSIVGTSFLTKELLPRQEAGAVQLNMNNVKIITNRPPTLRNRHVAKLAAPVEAIDAEYTG